MPSDSSRIPAGVRELLATIDSVEKLEIIGLLGRDVDVSWSSPALTDALGLPAGQIAPAVDELVADHLLVRIGDGQVRYGPDRPETEERIAALVRLYEEDKALVLRAMTEASLERIRVAARTFADSFLLRRRKPDDPA